MINVENLSQDVIVVALLFYHLSNLEKRITQETFTDFTAAIILRWKVITVVYYYALCVPAHLLSLL